MRASGRGLGRKDRAGVPAAAVATPDGSASAGSGAVACVAGLGNKSAAGRDLGRKTALVA